LLISLGYLIISLNYSLDSYDYCKRKERKKEKYKNWSNISKNPIFLKETEILWRDKLLFSILITSITMGCISGYLAISNDNSFLPENLQTLISIFPKEIYSFFGVYVLTIYASVFISLNSYLNEGNTLWIIRNLPISEKTIVKGKALALILPFICSIPFIAYFSAITIEFESFLFLTWFFIFSFLAGLIISFPIGARYVGKKSDILLLYSVSIIILIIIGISYTIASFINSVSFYVLTLLVEIGFLILSIEITSYILKIKYK